MPNSYQLRKARRMCGVPLAGDVITIRGKQEDLFA